MTAVFRVALGPDFHRLHPMLQRRFGFDSADRTACIGRGTMTQITRGQLWTVPFLRLGAWRNILFPENASDVPFTIENYAYTDGFGRETLTFVRTFELSPSLRRRFDATMVSHPTTGHVVDYLGTHQHLAVDLDARVDDRGALHLTSGEQRFHEGRVSFRFPAILTGRAELVESFDEQSGLFTIDVAVRNARFGHLFGYRGTFTCEWPETTVVPPAVKPVREERRP
ncbi:MAG: DUF4166 domain-containing protein [Humibacillus sp.]